VEWSPAGLPDFAARRAELPDVSVAKEPWAEAQGNSGGGVTEAAAKENHDAQAHV